MSLMIRRAFCSFSELLTEAHVLAKAGKRKEYYPAADKIIAKALDSLEENELRAAAEQLTHHARKLEATPLERVLAADLQNKLFDIEVSKFKKPKQ